MENIAYFLLRYHQLTENIFLIMVLNMPWRSYEDLLKEERLKYKETKVIHCPIIGANVYFTSKGFHHLLFDGSGRPRTKKERCYRLGLMPLLKPALFSATKVETYTPPAYSAKLGRKVEYWEIKSIVGKSKTVVTVILRKIGNGNITFYSIWKKQDRRK